MLDYVPPGNLLTVGYRFPLGPPFWWPEKRRGCSGKYLFSRPLGGGGGTQVCKWPKGLNTYTFETTVDRFCSVCVPTFGLHARQCYTFPVGFPLFSAIFVRSYTFSYVCYSLVFGSTAHFASRAMLPFLTIGSLVGSVPLIRESQNKRWLSFHPFSG